MSLGPCTHCGAPADRELAISPICEDCFDERFGEARARWLASIGGVGYGRQHGGRPPDFGPRFADLACTVCGATWVGPIGEPCSYCLAFLEAATDARRLVLLRPDLPDPDDPRRDRAVRAWTRALADAVRADLIHDHEARAALQRLEARRAA